MTSVEKKVKEIIEPIITNLNYTIYDVIYEKEGKENYLRIFIDSKKGISLNDCETVNNAITDILDEKDVIKGKYMLEISSPGIEKRIRTEEHLKENLNNKVQINTFKAIDKQKVLIGNLKSFNEKSIIIKTEEKEIEIERNNIIIMKTVYDW